MSLKLGPFIALMVILNPLSGAFAKDEKTIAYLQLMALQTFNFPDSGEVQIPGSGACVISIHAPPKSKLVLSSADLFYVDPAHAPYTENKNNSISSVVPFKDVCTRDGRRNLSASEPPIFCRKSALVCSTPTKPADLGKLLADEFGARVKVGWDIKQQSVSEISAPANTIRTINLNSTSESVDQPVQ